MSVIWHHGNGRLPASQKTFIWISGANRPLAIQWLKFSLIVRLRGHPKKKWINMVIQFPLCHVSLTSKLNFYESQHQCIAFTSVVIKRKTNILFVISCNNYLIYLSCRKGKFITKITEHCCKRQAREPWSRVAVTMDRTSVNLLPKEIVMQNIGNCCNHQS